MENSNTKREWGGLWTEDKLDCFEKYVKAYLTIMNTRRDAYHWELLYFDGFAGSGSRDDSQNEEEDMESIFGPNQIDDGDLRMYEGAAERVVRISQSMRGFDKYWFVEKNEDNLTRLEMKLAPFGISDRAQFILGDVNEKIDLFAEYLRSHPYTKSLCLLDPFGMNLNWESIEKIAGPSLDLWILIPTGTIVNRLIQKNGRLRYPERLSSFFGLSVPEIENRVYRPIIEPDLFGELNIVRTKIENSIEGIAQIYCEQLGTLFQHVTNKPLRLCNSKNVPIFHLVCAANKQTAVKIAQDVFNKQQNPR